MKPVGCEVLAALKIRQTKSAQPRLNYRITGDGQATMGFHRDEPKPHICTTVWNLGFHLGLLRPRLYGLASSPTWNLTPIWALHLGVYGSYQDMFRSLGEKPLIISIPTGRFSFFLVPSASEVSSYQLLLKRHSNPLCLCLCRTSHQHHTKTSTGNTMHTRRQIMHRP